MESSANGIDLGERETHALLGFCGETAALAQVVFKIKGKKLIAYAANGRAAVEYTGKNEGAKDGEYPVSRSFLKLCAAGAVEGSKHVPAQIARLLFDHSGIGAAVLVSKESGKEGPTVSNPDKIEPSAQLKFKEVHDLVKIDPERAGHWFAVSTKHAKPIFAIEAAADKCPITWIPAPDELSPIGFKAKGAGGEWCGILRPVEVAGPGKASTNPESDDDDDADNNDESDGRQLSLESRAQTMVNGVREITKSAAPSEEGEGDGVVVSDDYAARVKAQQARAEGDASDVPTAEKPKRKARASVKNRRQATN